MGVVQESASKDSALDTQDLYAALEASRTTQSALERQVQDLRNALKATGTPTEARNHRYTSWPIHSVPAGAVVVSI